MTECNKVNVKLLVSQLNKFKNAVKNQTGVTLKMNVKIFEEKNLLHELLLTARQKTKLRNAFENNMLTDIKLPKTQVSKIIQSGGFLGSLLSKIPGPIIKVAVPLAKDILAALGITAATSVIDAGIQKKKQQKTWFGATTLIIANEEMNDIMITVSAFEDSNILLKGITKTIGNET